LLHHVRELVTEELALRTWIGAEDRISTGEGLGADSRCAAVVCANAAEICTESALDLGAQGWGKCVRGGWSAIR
jgi:hypothetical protein